ncbi:MAG: DUF454 domain-containing protein, partial [Candidatus Moraniibacteriota bacterium]
MVETARGAKRLLYWLMAGVFFLLAMLGVALPGIPTTPFLLLMCYFLLRVSPAMHAKAMAWPLVGGPLRDWRDQGGVRRSVKHLAYGMVTLFVPYPQCELPCPKSLGTDANERAVLLRGPA